MTGTASLALAIAVGCMVAGCGADDQLIPQGVDHVIPDLVLGY